MRRIFIPFTLDVVIQTSSFIHHPPALCASTRNRNERYSIFSLKNEPEGGSEAIRPAGSPFLGFGFEGLEHNQPPGRWECGNRAAISKGCGKRRETWVWFSSFSTRPSFPRSSPVSFLRAPLVLQTGE